MAAPKKKKRNCGCLAIYAALGLFIIFGIVNVVQRTGQQLGILPTPTITPTPGPATATPIPIETPIPGPTVDTDEEPFRAEAQRILGAYSDALTRFGELARMVQGDPALLLTETWTLQMGGAVATIRALNNEIRALQAPPRYSSAWLEMRVAADKYDRAMDMFVSGVDARDTNQIMGATQQMLEGQEAINRAAVALPQ